MNSKIPGVSQKLFYIEKYVHQLHDSMTYKTEYWMANDISDVIDKCKENDELIEGIDDPPHFPCNMTSITEINYKIL